MKIIIEGVIEEEVMKACDYLFPLLERWLRVQKSNKIIITLEREGTERFEEPEHDR